MRQVAHALKSLKTQHKSTHSPRSKPQCNEMQNGIQNDGRAQRAADTQHTRFTPETTPPDIVSYTWWLHEVTRDRSCGHALNLWGIVLHGFSHSHTHIRTLRLT